MVTDDMQRAFKASMDNDKAMNDKFYAIAEQLHEGVLTIHDVNDAFINNFKLCMKLSAFVTKCFPWCSISAFDIPQCAVDYVCEMAIEIGVE